jgi:hypothetical protein
VDPVDPDPDSDPDLQHCLAERRCSKSQSRYLKYVGERERERTEGLPPPPTPTDRKCFHAALLLCLVTMYIGGQGGGA